MSSPRLVYERPSIATFETISQYQSSTPAEYALTENPVLYGGASNLCFTAAGEGIRLHPDLPGPQATVDLFVLDASVIFWFGSSGKGVEYPYPCLVLHALQTPQQLYLQLQPSPLIDVAGDHEYESVVEVLLESQAETNKELAADPLWRALYRSVDPTQVIPSLFTALSRCSALHTDSDEESENGDGPTLGDLPALRLLDDFAMGNQGHADDLSDRGEDDETEYSAGVLVDVAGPLAGLVRFRGEAGLDEGEISAKRVR